MVRELAMTGSVSSVDMHKRYIIFRFVLKGIALPVEDDIPRLYTTKRDTPINGSLF